jgi:RsiW-degrading membrane proteinase PrsW (M82 family)
MNMRTESPIAAPMPMLHVAAAALPGLTFVAMAGRGTPLFRGAPVMGLSWRQLTLSAAISMSLATLLAIYVETLGGFGGVLLLLVHHGAFEFARDSDDVRQILRHSDLILSRNEQFFAGLIVASICAPIAEEFGKGLAARFMFRPTTTRGQAFLLGAAAGAGFGFLEAMLYGLEGISSDLGNWWAIMLLRGGSTSGHVLWTGLTALGWWYWSIGRNRRTGLLLMGAAMAGHALWNGAFTAIDTRILGLETLSDRAIEIVAYVIVGIASAAFVLAIPLIARHLRDVSLPPSDETSLVAMKPWLA